MPIELTEISTSQGGEQQETTINYTKEEVEQFSSKLLYTIHNLQDQQVCDLVRKAQSQPIHTHLQKESHPDIKKCMEQWNTTTLSNDIRLVNQTFAAAHKALGKQKTGNLFSTTGKFAKNIKNQTSDIRETMKQLVQLIDGITKIPDEDKTTYIAQLNYYVYRPNDSRNDHGIACLGGSHDQFKKMNDQLHVILTGDPVLHAANHAGRLLTEHYATNPHQGMNSVNNHINGNNEQKRKFSSQFKAQLTSIITADSKKKEQLASGILAITSTYHDLDALMESPDRMASYSQTSSSLKHQHDFDISTLKHEVDGCYQWNMPEIKKAMQRILKVSTSLEQLPDNSFSLDNAIKAGWIQGVKKNLQQIDVNAHNKDGKTPLAIAIQHQQAEMVQFLLDQGADPNQRMNEKHPVSIALKKGSIEIAECLFNYPTTRLNRARTFYLACQAGAKNIVESCLSDPEFEELKKHGGGQLSLRTAVDHGQNEVIKALKSHGACYKEFKDHNHNTLIHSMLKNKLPEKTILDIGEKHFFHNKPNVANETPLKLAQDLGYRKVAANISKNLITGKAGESFGSRFNDAFFGIPDNDEPIVSCLACRTFMACCGLACCGGLIAGVIAFGVNSKIPVFDIPPPFNTLPKYSESFQQNISLGNVTSGSENIDLQQTPHPFENAWNGFSNGTIMGAFGLAAICVGHNCVIPFAKALAGKTKDMAIGFSVLTNDQIHDLTSKITQRVTSSNDTATVLQPSYPTADDIETGQPQPSEPGSSTDHQRQTWVSTTTLKNGKSAAFHL